RSPRAASPLSLHDALPILSGEPVGRDLLAGVLLGLVGVAVLVVPGGLNGTVDPIGAIMLFVATLAWALGTFLSPRLATPRNALRSEEHTSELQSRGHLVCR